ncbi:MAG TPA: insulinase family protein, partial [Magnetospirillaceae bacterium]|nr:insulinase family protein [Magnetospirillaceae bacterium]
FPAPLRREFPFAAEEASEARTTTLLTWLTVTPEDPVENLTMEILAEILLGSDGAPLAHALAESGLGEDLSPHSGLDTNLRQALLSAGLRGTERGREAAMEDLILDCVGGLVRTGIPADLLEAAFHSVEFSAREISRGGGTYGLRLLGRAMRGWLHGRAPEESLSFTAPLEELGRRRAKDPRYLEGRLRDYILDNPHRATVTVYPDPTLAEQRRRERRAGLDAVAANLSARERSRIRSGLGGGRNARKPADGMGSPDCVPVLRRSDIPEEIDLVPRESFVISGAAASFHPVFTNGIVYADLAFPLSVPAESQPYMPLLAHFVSGAGIPGRSYAELARELAVKAGGFSVQLLAATPSGCPPEAPSAWLVFRLKALRSNFPAALDIAMDLVTRADFGDHKRLEELLHELTNDMASAVLVSGSAYASSRSAALFSGAQRLQETWRGLSQYLFLSFLRSAADTATLAVALSALRDSVLGQAGLRVNLTTEPEAAESARAVLEAGISRIPPRPAMVPPFAPVGWETPPVRSEAWTLPVQVGFSAASARSSTLGTPGFAHEQALGHLLSTGYLWDEIRVKGGAYGASAWTDGAESTFSFTTYRDPAPNASLSSFLLAIKSVASGSLDDETLDRAVVGAAGRDLRPMMPEEKGYVDFRRELYGVTDEMRRRKRADLLGLRTLDLRQAAERLESAWGGRSEVLISHADDVESMRREKPGVFVRPLQL